LIVLIEAGPRIQAGFQKLAQLVSLLLNVCVLFIEQNSGYLTCCLPLVCWNEDILKNGSRASITIRGSDLIVLIEAGGFYSRIYKFVPNSIPNYSTTEIIFIYRLQKDFWHKP